MKKLSYLIACFSLQIYSQGNFDFEKTDLSDWIQIPAYYWGISAENAISGLYSLHHQVDNANAGADYIFRDFNYPDLSDTLEFSFRIRHAYAPSSNNNWQFFFLSDAPEFAESTHTLNSAFVFGVNFYESSDTLKLYQLAGGKIHELCALQLNYQENIGNENAPSVLLIRYPNGRWSISISIEGDISLPDIQAEIEEIFPLTGKYCGFRYAYSAAQDRKLWIDDLIIKGVFGLEYKTGSVHFGDLLINEIMPRPAPEIYLPGNEYIELFNNSDDQIELAGWKIVVNKRTYHLEPWRLESKSYLVLTGNQSTHISDSVQVQSVFSTNSVLPNPGARIELRDQNNKLIHFLYYSDLNYLDPIKSSGGWSLELIDPKNACHGWGNLSFSEDWKGGTPGAINSISAYNPDLESPEYLFYGRDETGLSFHFNEAIHCEQLIAYNPIDEFEYTWREGDSVSAIFSVTPPEQNSSTGIGEIRLGEIMDCAGNESKPIEVLLRPVVQADLRSVLINEVMFDPISPNMEYIELYLPGKEPFDLKDLKLCLATSSEDKYDAEFLSSISHILQPQSYLLLVRDEHAIREFWDLPAGMDIIQLKDWSSLPDKEGTIQLTNRSNKVIDQLDYSGEMHSDLIQNSTGVSLERMSKLSCLDPWLCWTSAIASASYGTPGEENSRWEKIETLQEGLTLSPAVFSPDMDGFEDVLSIQINSEEEENLINVFITDLRGNKVRSLLNNEIGSKQNTLIWDGRGDEGYTLQSGIYIVHVLLLSERRQKQFRSACALKYR